MRFSSAVRSLQFAVRTSFKLSDGLLLYLRNWLIVVVVVIGLTCLLERFAMQMIIIVLLAPCASALRVMLNICCSYASHHGLKFNPEKSQLICFRLRHTRPCSANINNDTVLPYVNEVAHLGHVLSYNLDDTPDIIRAVRDMNRKVNSILFTFSAADPSAFLSILTVCHSMGVLSGL